MVGVQQEGLFSKSRTSVLHVVVNLAGKSHKIRIGLPL